MDIKTLVEEHLVVNNQDDLDTYMTIVSAMQRDISALYEAARIGNNRIFQGILDDSDKVKSVISDYSGGGVDDANMGKILLLLNKIPVLAECIKRDIESRGLNLKGVEQIVAHDHIDEYVKGLFLSGYERLYKYETREQIATHLYYECEKFIDALVLEFKKDISHMIDKNNLVFDDVFYVRRLLKNLENTVQNNMVPECVGCDKNCNRCKSLPEKTAYQDTLYRYRALTMIMDEKINNGHVDLSKHGKNMIEPYGTLIRGVCALTPNDGPHKTIQLGLKPQNMSIISAKRFEKIIKRRYNEEAYRKDRDIYYILYHGINAEEIFTGDDLLENIEDLYLSYTQNNSESGK